MPLVLRFSLFGIPVGVHFSFLFVSFLALGIYNGSALVAFTLAIFLGVLVHEVGHAVTARAFGAKQVRITLFALGGVTVFSTDPPLSPARRFLISGAGSAAGIATGGPLLLLWRADAFDGLSRLAQIGVWSYIIAGLFWGVLNWIPIRPLDGGQMLTAGLEIITPRHADRIARVITVVVGVAAIIVAVSFEQYFAAFFVAFLVFVGARRTPEAPPRAEDQVPAPGTEDREPVGEPPEFPI